jgi:hypothetical protein
MRFIPYQTSLIIADWQYFVDNEQAIVDWVYDLYKDNDLRFVGMTIQLDSRDDMLVFLLRWE